MSEEETHENRNDEDEDGSGDMQSFLQGFDIVDELESSDGEKSTEKEGKNLEKICDVESKANAAPNQDFETSSTVKTTTPLKNISTDKKSTPTSVKVPLEVTPTPVSSGAKHEKSAPANVKTTPTQVKTLASSELNSTAEKTTPAAVRKVAIKTKTTPVSLKLNQATRKTTPTLVKNTSSTTSSTTSSVKTTPKAAKATPSKANTTPTAVKTTPSAVKTTPSAVKTTPSAVKTTPTIVKTTPTAAKATPTAVKTTPTAVKKTPSAVKTTPTAVKTTPKVKPTPVAFQKKLTAKTTPSEKETTHSTAKFTPSEITTPFAVKTAPTTIKTTPSTIEVSCKETTNVIQKPVLNEVSDAVQNNSAGTKTNPVSVNPASLDKEKPITKLTASSTPSEFSENEEEEQDESAGTSKLGKTIKLTVSSESESYEETSTPSTTKPRSLSKTRYSHQSSIESTESMESSSIDTASVSSEKSESSLLKKAFVQIVPLPRNITSITLTPNHPLLKPVKRQLSNEYDEEQTPAKRTLLLEESTKEFDKTLVSKKIASSPWIIASKSDVKSLSTPVKSNKAQTPSESLVQKAVAVFKTMATNQAVTKKSATNIQVLLLKKAMQKTLSTKESSSITKVPDTQTKGPGQPQTKAPDSQTKCLGPQTKAPAPQTKPPGPQTKAQGPQTKDPGPPTKASAVIQKPTVMTTSTQPKTTVVAKPVKGGDVTVVRTSTGKLIVKRRIIPRATKETMTESVSTRTFTTQTPGGSNDEMVVKDPDVIHKRMAEKHGRQTLNRLKTVMIHPVLPEDMADPVLQPFFKKCHCLSARFLGGSRKDLVKKGHLEVRFFSEEDASKYVVEMQGLKLASGKFVSAKILGQCGPWDGTLDDWQKTKQAEYEGLQNARCVYVHNIPPGTEETMLKLLYPDAVAVSIQQPNEDDKLSKGHALLEFSDKEEAETVANESKDYQTKLGDNILSLFFIGKKSLKKEETAPSEQRSEKVLVEAKTESPVAQKRAAKSKDSDVQPPEKKIKSEILSPGKLVKECKGSIKQFLFLWSESMNKTVHYNYVQSRRNFTICKCTVFGYPYVGRGEGNKGFAQTEAAYDFVTKLVQENIIDESLVKSFENPPKKFKKAPDDQKPKVSQPRRSLSPGKDHKHDSRGEERNRRRENEIADRRREREARDRSREKEVKDRRRKREEIERRREKEAMERRREKEATERTRENEATEKRRDSKERKSKEPESLRRPADGQHYKSPEYNSPPVYATPLFGSPVYKSPEKTRLNSPNRESVHEKMNPQKTTIIALKDEITKQLAELQEGRVIDPNRLSLLAKNFQTNSAMKEDQQSRKRAGSEENIDAGFKSMKMESEREVKIPGLNLLDRDDRLGEDQPAYRSDYTPPFQFNFQDNQSPVNTQTISATTKQMSSADTDKRQWMPMQPIQQPRTNIPFSNPRSTPFISNPYKAREFPISTLCSNQQAEMPNKSFYSDEHSTSDGRRNTYQPVLTTGPHLQQNPPMGMLDTSRYQQQTMGVTDTSRYQEQSMGVTGTSLNTPNLISQPRFSNWDIKQNQSTTTSFASNPVSVVNPEILKHSASGERTNTYLPVLTTGPHLQQNPPMAMPDTPRYQQQPTGVTDTSRYQQQPIGVTGASLNTPNLIPQSRLSNWDIKQNQSTTTSIASNPGSVVNPEILKQQFIASNPVSVVNPEILKQQLVNRLRQFQEGQLSDDSNIFTQLAHQLLRIQQQEGPDPLQSQSRTSTQLTTSSKTEKEEMTDKQGEEISESSAENHVHAEIREKLLLRLQIAGINSGTISSLVKGLKEVQGEQETESKSHLAKKKDIWPQDNKKKLQESRKKVQEQIKLKIQQIKENKKALAMEAWTKNVIPNKKLTAMGHTKGPVGLAKLQSGGQRLSTSSRHSRSSQSHSRSSQSHSRSSRSQTKGSNQSQSRPTESQFKAPLPISHTRSSTTPAKRDFPAIIQYPHLAYGSKSQKELSPPPTPRHVDTPINLVDYPSSP